jgi:O-antigen biosynthesis protein
MSGDIIGSDHAACLRVWLHTDGRPRTSTVPTEFEPNRWYLITDDDARLHPAIDQLLASHAGERPEIDIFYGDEVIGETGLDGPGLQLCKPCFDRTQIVAQDYIGWPILVRGNAIAKLRGLDPSAGTAATYDLILRALSEGIGIERIAEVLAVHRQAPPRSTTEDRAVALEQWRQRSTPGYGIRPGMVEGTFQLYRNFSDLPEVTLVVPTRQGSLYDKRDHGARWPMILDFLDNLCRTDWPMDRLSVLVGDDAEDGSTYGRRDWPFRLTRIHTSRTGGGTFNYSAKMNNLWRMAVTEHLVLMNDDLIARSAGWLRALMTFATNEEIGGVGARLLYPDDTIQHVGMPGGLLGLCEHAFRRQPASLRSYQNWAEVHREWSMVTGAVFATRKNVLEQVNGFDERFFLDYNDADMCLRLRLLGYRIVYTPFAEFTHYESVSRSGMVCSAEQTALFMERWRDLLVDDPAYHPRLTRSSQDIAPLRSGTDWWVIPPASPTPCAHGAQH